MGFGPFDLASVVPFRSHCLESVPVASCPLKFVNFTLLARVNASGQQFSCLLHLFTGVFQANIRVNVKRYAFFTTSESIFEPLTLVAFRDYFQIQTPPVEQFTGLRGIRLGILYGRINQLHGSIYIVIWGQRLSAYALRPQLPPISMDYYDENGLYFIKKRRYTEDFWTSFFLTERGDGGARGSRTPDLLNAIQALSQLSYGPKSFRDTGLCQSIRRAPPFFKS